MLLSLVDIEQQAKQLPANERARLAEALLESLKDDSLNEIQTAWRREIEERVAAYDRGDIETFSAAQVFAEARRLSR
jgi:putative addiction module component (TIGR02574 family)